MPKMKTNSSAKKRFALTGSGQIKRKKAISLDLDNFCLQSASSLYISFDLIFA